MKEQTVFKIIKQIKDNFKENGIIFNASAYQITENKGNIFLYLSKETSEKFDFGVKLIFDENDEVKSVKCFASGDLPKLLFEKDLRITDIVGDVDFSKDDEIEEDSDQEDLFEEWKNNFIKQDEPQIKEYEISDVSVLQFGYVNNGVVDNVGAEINGSPLKIEVEKTNKETRIMFTFNNDCEILLTVDGEKIFIDKVFEEGKTIYLGYLLLGVSVDKINGESELYNVNDIIDKI